MRVQPLRAILADTHSFWCEKVDGAVCVAKPPRSLAQLRRIMSWVQPKLGSISSKIDVAVGAVEGDAGGKPMARRLRQTRRARRIRARRRR